MNNNSSFDPLDYYKKLTMCLANKKNCKVNLSRVPGGKEIKENKRLPNKITDQRLQARFLSKYNEKKKQQQPAIDNNILKQNPLNFNVQQQEKQPAASGMLVKRKKEDESFLNLPANYFQSINIPDLAIFKVPDDPPPIKKTKSDKVTAAVKSNNFTLDSLFSGNFKPPRASTPVEEEPPRKSLSSAKLPKPIISDPSEILSFIVSSRSQCLEAYEKSKQGQKAVAENPGNKVFLELVDKAAKEIDSKSFPHIADPTLEILELLNKAHDIASQSPRPSLLSESTTTRTNTQSISSSKRPVPTFYEQEDKNYDCNTTLNTNYSFIRSVSRSSSQHDDVFNDDIFTPTTFDFTGNDVVDDDISILSDDSIFERVIRTPLTATTTFNSDVFLMTPPSPQKHKRKISEKMEFNWLDDVFTSFELDMSHHDEESNENVDERVGDEIFKSPPHHRLLFDRKFSQKKHQLFDERVEGDNSFEMDMNNISMSSLWSNQSAFTIKNDNNNNHDDIFDTTFDLF